MINDIRNYNYDQYKKANNLFIDKIKVCHQGTDSLKTPFFQPNIDNDIDINKYLSKTTNLDYVDKLNSLSQKFKFSKLLYYIYLIIGDTTTEFVINLYTFFSLDNIESQYNVLEKNGQTKICDIAVSYAGMGHVNVLSIDIGSGKLYTRPDGGSNGYDRDDNFKFSLTVDLQEYQDKLYEIDKFLLGDETTKLLFLNK